MAEEQNQQDPQGQGQGTPNLTDDDFDWASYFLDDEAGDAGQQQTPPPTPPPADDDDDDDAGDGAAKPSAEVIAMRKELEEAKQTAARALAMASQSQTQSKMQAAIDAWRRQASPAELELEGMLLESKSPEELQRNATMVKSAAAKLSASQAEREAKIRREMELQMQKEFGIPIPPTFQPMPESEKINQLLKDGDLDAAADAMLKGMF